MKILNKIMAVTFGLIALALAAAGFYNKIHFLFAFFSTSLAVLALIDNKHEATKDSY